MAMKTANVLARVEPDVKEQAEAIMAKLGVPASRSSICFTSRLSTRGKSTLFCHKYLFSPPC